MKRFYIFPAVCISIFTSYSIMGHDFNIVKESATSTSANFSQLSGLIASVKRINHKSSKHKHAGIFNNKGHVNMF